MKQIQLKPGHFCFCQVGPNSFELVNLLGRGSFGEVFQVKHKRTGKAYAMKVPIRDFFVSEKTIMILMKKVDFQCFWKVFVRLHPINAFMCFHYSCKICNHTKQDTRVK